MTKLEIRGPGASNPVTLRSATFDKMWKSKSMYAEYIYFRTNSRWNYIRTNDGVITEIGEVSNLDVTVTPIPEGSKIVLKA